MNASRSNRTPSLCRTASVPEAARIVGIGRRPSTSTCGPVSCRAFESVDAWSSQPK